MRAQIGGYVVIHHYSDDLAGSEQAGAFFATKRDASEHVEKEFGATNVHQALALQKARNRQRRKNDEPTDEGGVRWATAFALSPELYKAGETALAAIRAGKGRREHRDGLAALEHLGFWQSYYRVGKEQVFCSAGEWHELSETRTGRRYTHAPRMPHFI